VSAPHSWQPINLVALGDAPPETPSIAGLLYPRNLHIVFGEPEAVKTWLCLVVCKEQISTKQHVVWIDLEMSPYGIRGRLAALGATDAELERFHYVQPSEPISDPRIQADIATLVATHVPTVVVVDAMAGALALHGFDPNSNGDVEVFYSSTLAPWVDEGWIESRPGGWQIGSAWFEERALDELRAELLTLAVAA
jgi:hypothetical protein